VSDQVSHPLKKTGKITVQYILIFILNKMYMHNNNLLQKCPFGRLSRWLPQPKNVSPWEISTRLAPIYRTSI